MLEPGLKLHYAVSKHQDYCDCSIAACIVTIVFWCRYTPLDYALMGEHFEVAQYMIEHGAVSITGIQDIAALKIQASCNSEVT